MPHISVKKDDPPLELPSLPTVPTNFSDLWNTIKSSASSLISDNQEKVPEIIHKVEEKVVENSQPHQQWSCTNVLNFLIFSHINADQVISMHNNISTLIIILILGKLDKRYGL